MSNIIHVINTLIVSFPESGLTFVSTVEPDFGGSMTKRLIAFLRRAWN